MLMINRKSRFDNELIAVTTPQSPVSEQFRRLRTNLNFSSVNGELGSLLVTSPNAGEGKSMVAANLAVVYAQEGKKVLLVDGDMRNPTVHESFQTTNDVGLSSLLAGRVGVATAVRKTSIENLDFLAAGPVPPNPSELLGSAAMEQLMNSLTKSYGLVIFDSPPLLPVVDAQIIASKCDGSILVIHSGKTDRSHVLQTQEALAASGTQLLGVILNKAKPALTKSYR